VHVACEDAHFLGFVEPSQLHHQDHTIRQGCRHSELHEHTRRAPPDLAGDGEEESDWDLEFHEPRRGKPQRDSGNVQGLRGSQLQVEELHPGGAG